MRFVSTKCRRNDQTQKFYTFKEAVLAGWAEDGSMLLPESFPILSQKEIKSFAGLSYPDLCIKIMSLFIDEDQISADDLKRLFSEAFARFGDANIVNVTNVKPTEGYGAAAASQGIDVCELWAGATLAFKDLGMSVLGHVLNHFLEQDKAKMIVLVGTSGDTGSAAIEALGGLNSVEIVTLYPKDRCSAVQELQMTKGNERYSNSTLIRVEGTSDDLDEPIEAILHNVELKRELNIGSVNSVNIVRLLIQTVHYFYAYLQLQPEVKQVVSFAVPTGAGGHVTAGVIAAHMGLPVQSLLVATNENDIMHRFLLDSSAEVADMVDTNSPSMDVQVPYNIERLLWIATGGDGVRVNEWMTSFRATRKLTVPEEVSAQLRDNCRLVSTGVTNKQVETCIQRLHAQCNYLLDPHTAVGVHAGLAWQTMCMQQADADEDIKGKPPTVIAMACAHPAKFSEVICKSTGMTPEEFWNTLPNKDNRHVDAVAVLAKETPSGFLEMVRGGEDWLVMLQRVLREVKDKQMGKQA